MNNDFEDNEDFDLDDSSFDDFEEKDKTLGGFMKDNPIAKVGIIAGVIVVVFGVIIFAGGDSSTVENSFINQAPDIAAPPGTEAASQEYIEAIQEVNERDREIAEATGGSALPTPIEPPVGVLTVPEQDVDEEDPLQRWRRLQEERLQRELQQAQTIEPTALPDDTARQEQLEQLAEAMSSQMQAVLDSKEVEISYLSITNLDEFLKNIEERNGNSQQDGFSGSGFDDGELDEEIIQEVLLAAGEIEYAQLLIEANTDAPGPIMAQILTGPLKGGRLIGSFEAQNEYLTLNFSTLSLNDEVLTVDAIAIDPKTTLPGFVTEINNRYLQRILLPAAAAFITGFAEAVAESGRTSVTIEGETVSEDTEDASTEEEVASGITEAGEAISEIIDEEVDEIEPLIRVEVGTPLGILFVSSVTTQDDAI
ncbi:MAG: type IV secretion protein DotG [Bdellovibrionales bacterium]